MTRPAGKQALDAAIGERPLDGERLAQLHLHLVSLGHVKTAIGGAFARSLHMEQREHRATGIHVGVKVLDNGHDKWFGEIIEGGPQQDDIKDPAAKIEGSIEELL